MDGRWREGPDAALSLLRWDPWGGPALAESLPVRRGRTLHVEAHLARLDEASRALGYPRPRRAALARVLRQAPGRCGLSEGGLRLRWWGGLKPALNLVIPLPAPAPAPPGGWRLMTAAVRQGGAGELGARVKSSDMLASLLARSEIAAFADDGLRLTPEGWVAEGVWSNIAALKNGVIRSPPVPQGLLEGVTRAVFLRSQARAGWRVRQEPLTRFDLWTAERVWVLSSLRGVGEVANVDGRRVGNAEAPGIPGTPAQAGVSKLP